MNGFGILGLFLALGTIASACLLGGPADIFINVPAVVIVVGLTLGIQLSAEGAGEFRRTLSSLVVALRPTLPKGIHSGTPANLRTLGKHVYAAGLIGFLIGGIQILASIDDWRQLASSIGTLLLVLFYALILAECIIRPCANRVEQLLVVFGHDSEDSAEQEQ